MKVTFLYVTADIETAYNSNVQPRKKANQKPNLKTFKCQPWFMKKEEIDTFSFMFPCFQ